jgi:hypothetical protein
VRTRRLGARAGICAAVAWTAAGLIALGPLPPSAGPEAHAKPATAPGAPPPGQAKKVAQGDAAAPVAAKSAKPEKPSKPKQAGGPKAVAPPVAAPSQVEPAVESTPVPAPSPAAATSPAAESPTRSQRSGSGARERTRGDANRSRSAPQTSRAPARGPQAPTGSEGSASTARPDAATSRPSTEQRRDKPSADQPSPVVRTVRDIVEIVPGWMKVAIAALAALSLLLAAAYAISVLRARSLARQRSELLSEVGLLQKALLPAVPAELAALRTSVSYRPADGPAAGGDFYDVLPLSDGRAGFVLGDLSGHGREALERTAFMRYTLRAYLEAGLEPRVALQVAGRVIGDGLDGDFATVLLAVHDPRNGALTFATAGHPAPIVVGGRPFEPVIAATSPPIGIGERTGLRQTTVPLVPRSVACLYTDGLIEARTRDGLLGRDRLEELVAELGPEATAEELLELVASEAVTTPDDMAACLLTPRAGVTSGGFRTEQLELSAEELDGPLLERFLDECGVPPETCDDTICEARQTSKGFGGGAIVNVVFGNRRSVEVLPRNVESIEAASRRAA